MRPAVQQDGGDLQVVSVDPETGVVHVTLQGACSSCAISTATLEVGVKRILTDRVPWITEVVGDVDDTIDEATSARWDAAPTSQRPLRRRVRGDAPAPPADGVGELDLAVGDAAGPDAAGVGARLRRARGDRPVATTSSRRGWSWATSRTRSRSSGRSSTGWARCTPGDRRRSASVTRSSWSAVPDRGDLFPAFLYVYVDDADSRYERAVAAGAASLESPRATPYGDRRAMVPRPVRQRLPDRPPPGHGVARPAQIDGGAGRPWTECRGGGDPLRRADRPALRDPLARAVRPAVVDPAVDFLAALAGRGHARARDRDGSPRAATQSPRGGGARDRAVISDGRAAPDQARRRAHRGDDRRLRDRPRRRDVHASRSSHATRSPT